MAANQHTLPPADAALAAALVGPLPGEDSGGDADLLTLDELAAHCDLPAALLEAVEREGLLIPRSTDSDRRYTTADAEALQAGLALVEAGLPLDELFNLARAHTAAMRTIADHAVELFVRFVRDPIQSQATDDDDAAAQLLAAFGQMLPATGTLVGHHFRRLLVNAATTRLQGVGERSEPAGGDLPGVGERSEPAGGDLPGVGERSEPAGGDLPGVGERSEPAGVDEDEGEGEQP